MITKRDKSLSVNFIKKPSSSANSINSTFTAAVQSTLLVFLLFFPLTLLHLIVHEGGHALVNLINNVPHTSIYVHPFSFLGFSRPVLDWTNVWMHLGGTITSLVLASILFIFLWKLRSYSNLLVMIYIAWTAFWEGLGLLDILGKTGDFYNVSTITGLPVGVFFIIDLALFLIGITLFVSLIPLFGLRPKNLNSLWVLPGGMGLFALVGLGVAYWLVPGSPYALQYGLVNEILISANFRPLLLTVAGLLFAGLYVSLYRFTYPKLPAVLHTETRQLNWSDLRWPAFWAALSILLGLMLIL